MFYSRQTIKLQGGTWLKLGGLVFNRNNEVVVEFEKRLTRELGGRVVTGSSMRDLLALTIRYYIEKTGKKRVAISKYSHFSNLNAIVRAGGEPVFWENIKSDKGKKQLMGVVVGHLHGVAQDMDWWMAEAKKFNWVVFEDCAHSFGVEFKGKKVGTFGVGLFSFGLGKIVTAFGGGAVYGELGLVDYLEKKRQLSKSFGSKNLKMLIKAGIFQVITTTYWGSLGLKLLMGLLLVLNKDNLLVEKTILEKGKGKGSLSGLTNMQATVGLEYLDRYKRENELRQEKAKTYNKVLKLYSLEAGDIFFHYLIETKQPGKVKWWGWKHNLDVQDDYCENVEDLYTKKGVGEKKVWLYLPTNPEIPESLIKKFAFDIKEYVEKSSFSENK